MKEILCRGIVLGLTATICLQFAAGARAALTYQWQGDGVHAASGTLTLEDHIGIGDLFYQSSGIADFSFTHVDDEGVVQSWSGAEDWSFRLGSLEAGAHSLCSPSCEGHGVIPPGLKTRRIPVGAVRHRSRTPEQSSTPFVWGSAIDVGDGAVDLYSGGGDWVLTSVPIAGAQYLFVNALISLGLLGRRRTASQRR